MHIQAMGKQRDQLQTEVNLLKEKAAAWELEANQAQEDASKAKAAYAGACNQACALPASQVMAALHLTSVPCSRTARSWQPVDAGPLCKQGCLK